MQYAARARHIRCNPIQNVAVGLGAGGGSASGDDEGGVQLHLKEVLRLRSRLEERTREFNELKLRLEHLEDERKARNRTQTMSSNSASTGGQAKPGDGHAAAAETALVEQYQRQIDQLQLRNEAEHKQLQEKMRYIIHSHEGTLAIKEKAYSTLEQELQYAQSRATALIQEKDRAVYSQHELERLNRQLRQENQQLKASLHASNTRLSDVERLLGSERDKAAAAAMSEADREQFVGALQKLTASRAKHKQRADKLQEELQTLIQQNGELSAKQVETKKQLLEQEVLLKSAVERIKMLCPIVGATAKSDDPQSPSPAAVLEAEAKAAAAAAKSDSAAASASAILIASTEMSAREQAMLKQELQEVLEQRNEARMQLDALKMVHATTAIERDQTIERMQAQERENTMQVTQHAQAHAQTEALLRAQLESLSGSLTQLQEEYEVHKAQAHEMRMQAEALLQEKEQDRLQLLHRLNESQGESLRMGEANQSLRVQLEEQVAQCDVLRSELLISQEQQQPDADEAMPASVLGSEMDTAASGGASPRSMNRSLRATISQLQEAELGLFRTMEEKLRDLDAARTKLHRLKSFNEQRGSPLRSPSPPSPVSVSALERAAEVLRVNLRQSEQKAESRYVELLAARQQVTELHIRLEASRTALAKEQDHSQALLQSMEQQREDHIDEIERMTALVRDRVASRQGARRSEDTSVSWPEDEAQGKLGDSSAPLDSEQQEERGHLPDWVDEEENMLTEKLFDDEEDTVCSDDFVFASGPPTAF